MINDKANDAIEIWLKTPMRGSSFIVICVHLLYYKCCKIEKNINKKDSKYF